MYILRRRSECHFALPRFRTRVAQSGGWYMTSTAIDWMKWAANHRYFIDLSALSARPAPSAVLSMRPILAIALTFLVPVVGARALAGGNAPVSREWTAEDQKQLNIIERLSAPRIVEGPPLGKRARIYTAIIHDGRKKIFGGMFTTSASNLLDERDPGTIGPPGRYVVSWHDFPKRVFVVQTSGRGCGVIYLAYDVERRTLDAFGCA